MFVYLGHGNGWPSIYPPFQTLTKDGLGLDPSSGADGSKHVYYGEDYIRDNIRFAPNAVVLLYHLCYASGNTEPGLAAGHVRRRPRACRQLRRRVHRRRRAGRDRRGPPGPPGDPRDRRAVHDQPDDGPGLPHGAVAARPPAGPDRVPAHAGPRVRDGRGHGGAVGLLPLDRRRPRRCGRAPSRARRRRRRWVDPGRLRGPRRRRGRRAGRRRAVRVPARRPATRRRRPPTTLPDGARLRITREAEPAVRWDARVRA